MIASAMDVIFAAEDAQFLASNFQYFSVPWDIGARKAKELLFEARFISGVEAHELGLVNRVVPGDRLLDEARGFVRGLAETSSPASLMHMKHMIYRHLMLPLGGTREIGSHKAYSQAVMWDILCGLLSGGGPGFRDLQSSCHHFIAYRIDAFTDLESFKDDMDFYMKSLRECTPAPGEERVLYAGLPEYETYQDRSVNGIPYHPEVIDWFREKTAELGVEHRLGE